MATTVPELTANLDELRHLRSLAQRPFVQGLLDVEISKIEGIIAEKERRELLAATASSSTVKTTSEAQPLPTVKLTNFGTDQSDKFMKIYITLTGVQSVAASNIESSFTRNSASVAIRELNGKNYEFTVLDLAYEIVPEESVVKAKTDTVLVMLRKKVAKNWDGLTKLEQQAKEKEKSKFKTPDMDGDPQGSIMSLMKQMYDDGDDEMKRSIKKAWHESQSKKGMAGLTDFE